MWTSKSLVEITNHIQIDSSKFLIAHHNLSPFSIAENIIKKLRTISQEKQLLYFKSNLQKYLYKIYFQGLSSEIDASKNQTNKYILERIAAQYVDWEFYEQLDNNNDGKGFFHPLYHVIKEEPDGNLLADFDTFLIQLNPTKHLPVEQQLAQVNDPINLWLCPSFMSRFRYRANGDYQGESQNRKNKASGAYIFLNFTTDAAISAMKSVTEYLNLNKVSFAFEVLHNPLNYGGYYSGWLSCNSIDYKDYIYPILKIVYLENKSQFAPEVPIFTKMIAPGIGLGEHPTKLQFRPQQGFGQNRCEIVANALLEAHQNGDESPEARMQYITQHFERLEIDLERPYLNPGSEDVYTPLDVTNDMETTKTSNKYQMS
jgi:hypothetical protein